MTRVLHVQKVSGISGSEAHLLSALPIMRADGFDARMLVLHEGEPGAEAFLAALREAQVPALELRLRGDVDPAAFARLVTAIRRERPQIVHTHLFHADVYGLPAAALARVPVRVSTKHGFNEFRGRRTIALADRAAGRLARRQIAISAGLARYLERTEGFRAGTFAVVHYGIALGPEPPPAPLEPRAAALGRLIPIKGFDVLLDAFARARAEVPGLTLELGGDGPLAGELRAAAPDGVSLPGRISPVEPFLERASFVVVPSRGEGFGMVALEAMERGRAVIASAVGGLPELVADGETGLVVPPEDPAALARAIVELARDPERARAMGEAARRRAADRFRDEAAARGVEAVYRDALG